MMSSLISKRLNDTLAKETHGLMQVMYIIVYYLAKAIQGLDNVIFENGQIARQMQLRLFLVIHLLLQVLLRTLRPYGTISVICLKNIARIANAVQVTICLLVSTNVY